MAQSDIEWNGLSTKNMGIIPVDRLTRETIRNIPVGVHILIANLDDSGVEFSGSVFTKDVQEQWIDNLANETDAYENTSVFYVNPAWGPHDDSGLKAPEQIADECIKENYTDDESLYQAIESESVTPDAVRTLLIQAVTEARKGLVQNPF